MEEPEPIVACPGYCCSDIVIELKSGPLTVEKLETAARNPAEKWARFYLERMLVPLGKDARGADHFDCNFFDRTSRRCTIYAERPDMCRAFPGAAGCIICTYDPRTPDVPGVLRPQFESPDVLAEFLRTRMRKSTAT